VRILEILRVAAFERADFGEAEGADCEEIEDNGADRE
jgi:hypothetical protein